ncbi:PREDICTED: HVA22-like protein k isoform X1 [Lupinus angustifolius]|uniref:HVA22-like protein k isoform X1 n=1 Tax=Lupinus angustifolius TaxID=3871 RepID=UPI00092F937C|nr:PREDICTED: HVA22-like protein k isoform X1 [Lupinus angustifolius]
MDLLGASNVAGEVGLRLLLSPIGSNVVIRTAWLVTFVFHYLLCFKLLFNYPVSIFCSCSVGIALPVYSTFKAIESKDQNAQHKCLLYWAAYGSFSLVEVFTDKLISWCPMYYHMKFAFLVWLQLPPTNGAKQLYVNHLRPFLLRHQGKIDQILGLASSELIKLVSLYQTEIKFVRDMVVKITGSGDQSSRGTTESNRSRQLGHSEDTAVPSDAETDRSNNS